MSKSIQISDLSHLEFKSWSNVKYHENGKNKKICSGWGSRTFFRVDNKGNLQCKKFNLFQRLAHSLGYKSNYSGKALFTHLQDKNIVKMPRKGRMDKLIASSLKAFKIEPAKPTEPKKTIPNEFVRQINDPTTTDATLINFLKANPDVSIHDKIDGFTPAFLAAKTKRLELLTHLVDQGVDVNVRCDGTNESATTPLHAALDQSYLGMCEYLLNNGADINAQNTEGDTPVHLLIEMCEKQERIPTGLFNTALHQSDNNNGILPSRVLENVLRKNADLTIVNHQQETAAIKAAKLNQPQILRTMIENHHADVHFVNANGDNILTFAYASANTQMVNMLTRQFHVQISIESNAQNVVLLALGNNNISFDMIEQLIDNDNQLVTDEVIIKSIEVNRGVLYLLQDEATKITSPGALMALANLQHFTITQKVVAAVTDDVLQQEGDEALIAGIRANNNILVRDLLDRYAACNPAKQITSPGVLVALANADTTYFNDRLITEIVDCVADDVVVQEGDDALIAIIQSENQALLGQILTRYETLLKVPGDRVFETPSHPENDIKEQIADQRDFILRINEAKQNK